MEQAMGPERAEQIYQAARRVVHELSVEFCGYDPEAIDVESSPETLAIEPPPE